MNSDDKRRLTEGENWFWRLVLPYTDHFAVAVTTGMWLYAAWSFAHGAWVVALFIFAVGSLNVYGMWARYRNQAWWRQRIMEIHAMEEIERPDPS